MQGSLALPETVHAHLVAADGISVGVDDDVAPRSIDDDKRAGADVAQQSVDADHVGYAECPGYDRRVRGRSATFTDDGGNTRSAQRKEVERRKVATQRHAALGRLVPGAKLRQPDQHAEQALAD